MRRVFSVVLCAVLFGMVSCGGDDVISTTVTTETLTTTTVVATTAASTTTAATTTTAPTTTSSAVPGIQPTAELVLYGLAANGAPIGDFVVYTAATDPNELLGRPGGYESKVNFRDQRLEVERPDDLQAQDGGSVEVFDNATGAERRSTYVQSFSGGLLGTEYHYISGSVLVRVSGRLTPDQAGIYKSALEATMAELAAGIAQGAPSTSQVSTAGLSAGCAEATVQMVGALDVLFNRFDADPAGMEEAMENSSEFGDLMRELGRVAGAECGLTESGAAISEILVYLADEAATRPSQTTEAVLGVMMGICRSLSSLPVELTYEGQAACAGTG